MCKVRCWRWFFGNKIPISLPQAPSLTNEMDPDGARKEKAANKKKQLGWL